MTENVKYTVEQRRLLRNSRWLLASSDSLYLQFKLTIWAQSYLGKHTNCTIRTVARKWSIGGLYVCVGGFTFVQWGLTFKFDKSSINVQCFVSQYGDLGALFGGTKPTKAPHDDGTVQYPTSRTSFADTITSCRKTAVVFKLNKVIFAEFFTSTAKIQCW